MDDFTSVIISAIMQVLLFSCIPFLCWLAVGRKKETFFQWIGVKRPVFHDSLFKTLAIAAGAAIIYTIAMIIIVNYFMKDVQDAAYQFSGRGITAIPSILVYAIIQTSLSEEIFFRGFLCKRLSNRFGFVTGNLIQSLCFGLLHGIPFGIATNSITVCLLLTLLPGAIGYLQGWLNEKKSGGSIISSWILHALMNLLSAIAKI